MKLLLLSLLLTSQVLSQSQSASLSITSFAPPTFRLVFSSNTSQPSFQLFFNLIPITYTFINQSTAPSNLFLFEANISDISIKYYTAETYTLVFKEPLTMFDGQLGINYFSLNAEEHYHTRQYAFQPMEDRDNLYPFQQEEEWLNILAITAVIILYTLSVTDIVGLWSLQFAQIYAYIQLYSSYYTYFDYRLSYFLLFEPYQISDLANREVYLCIPFILLFFGFAIALLSRYFLQEKRKEKWIWRITHFFFSYKFFIILWRILIIPLLINTIHLINNLLEQSNSDNYSFPTTFEILYIYFGILLIVAYLYFATVIMNPQCKQRQEEWKTYMKSSHFFMFRTFHNSLQLQSWQKRNYNIFTSYKRIVIILLVTFFNSNLPNIILQCLQLFYLFTIRPYKYKFYTQASIVMQLLVCIFFIFLSLANLYFSLSPYISTSRSITISMIFMITTFFLILLCFLGLCGYELYEKIKKLKNSLNEYKHNRKSKVYREKLFAEDNGNFEIMSPQIKRTKTKIEEKKNEKDYMRKRGISIIKIKEKKKIQKKSLLQNVAKNGQ